MFNSDLNKLGSINAVRARLTAEKGAHIENAIQVTLEAMQANEVILGEATARDIVKLSDTEKFLVGALEQFGETDELEQAAKLLYGEEAYMAALESSQNRGLAGTIAHGIGSAVGAVIVFALKIVGNAIAFLGKKSAEFAKETAVTTFKEVSDHVEISTSVGSVMQSSGFWLSPTDARDIIDTLMAWGGRFLNMRQGAIIDDFMNRDPRDTLDQYYPIPSDRSNWWYDAVNRKVVIFTDEQKRAPLKSLSADWTIEDLRYLTMRSIALERMLQQYHNWLNNLHTWKNSKEGVEWFDQVKLAQLPDNERTKREDDHQLFHKFVDYIASWGQAATTFDFRYRSFEMGLVGVLREIEAKKERGDTEGLKDWWKKRKEKKVQKAKEAELERKRKAEYDKSEGHGFWFDEFVISGLEEKLREGALKEVANKKITGISPAKYELWKQDVSAINALLYRVAKSDEFKNLELDDFEEWLEAELNKIKFVFIKDHKNANYFGGLETLYNCRDTKSVKALGYTDIDEFQQWIIDMVNFTWDAADVSTTFNDSSDDFANLSELNDDNFEYVRDRIGGNGPGER